MSEGVVLARGVPEERADFSHLFGRSDENISRHALGSPCRQPTVRVHESSDGSAIRAPLTNGVDGFLTIRRSTLEDVRAHKQSRHVRDKRGRGHIHEVLPPSQRRRATLLPRPAEALLATLDDWERDRDAPGIRVCQVPNAPGTAKTNREQEASAP